MKLLTLVSLFSLQLLVASGSKVVLSSEPAKYICIYKLTYRPDSTNKETKSENMLLTIGSSSSLFEGFNSHKSDSIIESPSFGPEHTSVYLRYIKTEFTYKIIKDYRNKTTKFYDKIGLKLYDIEQKNENPIWRLNNNTKQVAGYTCKNATTDFAGRKWEAWFTTEIPISDGPYKFKGLPGLIMELHDGKNDYIFSLTKFREATNYENIPLFKNTIKTIESDFANGKYNYRLEGVKKVSKENQSPEIAKALVENFKRKQANKNNHIELR